MVLERQPQQINRNINEIYFNNIKETITMETENRKRLHYETYRAQQLGNCYKNLISQEKLYAPAKFRTKVKKIFQHMNSPFTGKPLWIMLIVKNHTSPRKTNKLDRRNRKRGHINV